MLDWTNNFSEGDVAWGLTASVLVWLVYLPGWVLVYCGLFGGLSPLDLARRGLVLGSVLTLAWGLWVYSLAFGPSWGTVPTASRTSSTSAPTDFQTIAAAEENVVDQSHLHGRGGVIGNAEYMLFEKMASEDSTANFFPTRRSHPQVPHALFVVYQLMLFVAAPAPLIVVLSTRMSPLRLGVFLIAWGTFVYAPLVHWVWGDGWLGFRGTVDAGGGLLHLGVGVTALAAALFVPKRGMAGPIDTSEVEAPSAGLASFGAILVWIGSVVVHSTFDFQRHGQATVAMLNTVVATAMSVLIWGAVSHFVFRRVRPIGLAAGAVAGAVAASAACAVIVPQSALVVGFFAGTVGGLIFEALYHRIETNGAWGVFVLQGICGAIGVTLAGVFAVSSTGVQHWNGQPVSGFVESGNVDLLINQLIAVGAAAALALVGTTVILLLLGAARPRFMQRSSTSI